MDIDSLDNALKLQEELTSRLQRGLDALRTTRGLSTGALIRDAKERLTAAQAELDAAVQERADVASRWDEVIARRKATVESLTKEIAAIAVQPAGPEPATPQPTSPLATTPLATTLQPVRSQPTVPESITTPPAKPSPKPRVRTTRKPARPK